MADAIRYHVLRTGCLCKNDVDCEATAARHTIRRATVGRALPRNRERAAAERIMVLDCCFVVYDCLLVEQKLVRLSECFLVDVKLSRMMVKSILSRSIVGIDLFVSTIL